MINTLNLAGVFIMSTIRILYEEHHGIKLKDDEEVHHILPKHAGGGDNIENLVHVTKEEHKDLHMKRYLETGDFRDLCAYHMIGYNFSKAHLVSSSEGGKIGGKKVKESRSGIFRSEEDRKKWASMGGKVGGVVQRDMKLGIHAQTREERLAFASSGGKVGAFTMPHIQSSNGKKGGVKNKGFIWFNDGIKSYKYTTKMQKEKSIEGFLKENPNYKIGRTVKIVTCIHCGKSGINGAMHKWHFQNCKYKP